MFSPFPLNFAMKLITYLALSNFLLLTKNLGLSGKNKITEVPMRENPIVGICMYLQFLLMKKKYAQTNR